MIKKVVNFRILIQIIFLGFMIFSVTILERSISRLIVLSVTFLIGSYHCGWICPFGTIQEYMSKIRKKFIRKTYNVPEKIDKILSPIRYIPLFISVILITDVLNARKIMFSLLRGKQIAIISLVVLVIFLIFSLFIDRPFCRWFCVDGARYGLLSFGRILTIKRDNEKCVNCQKCDKSCPMEIKVSQHNEILNPKCINCLSCIAECPERKTLSIGIRSFSGKYNLISFFGALVFGIWILTRLLK